MILLLVAAENASSGADPADVRRALLMAWVLGVLLAIFVFAVLLLSVLRRRNARRTAQRRKAERLADPWRESAERLRPYEPPDAPPQRDEPPSPRPDTNGRRDS